MPWCANPIAYYEVGGTHHIAKDPERASRRRNVETLGGKEAKGAIRNDVIGEREGVGLAVDDEVHVRGISVAVDEVL